MRKAAILRPGVRLGRVMRAIGFGRTVVHAVAVSLAACVPIETEWTQKYGETFPPFEFGSPPAPDKYDYSDADGYYYADYSDYYGDYYDGYYWEDTSDSYYYYDSDTTDGYYYYYYWTYPRYWWSYWYYSDYYGHYGGSDGPTRTIPDSGGSAF